MRSGKELFEKSCRLCHGLDRSLAPPRYAALWEKIVKRMVTYGAPLNAGQRPLVARYLATQSVFARKCATCHEAIATVRVQGLGRQRQCDPVQLFHQVAGPGLRVGWIAGGRFQRQVEMLKFITSIATPELPQLAVAEFIANGGYDQHLRRMRAAFQQQVQRTTEAVAEYFPTECKLTQPAGGFVLWVELPPKVDAVRLFELAREKRIAIAPGPMFTNTGRYRNFIRLNCGHRWSARLEAAVARLGRLVRELA